MGAGALHQKEKCSSTSKEICSSTSKENKIPGCNYGGLWEYHGGHASACVRVCVCALVVCILCMMNDIMSQHPLIAHTYIHIYINMYIYVGPTQLRCPQGTSSSPPSHPGKIMRDAPIPVGYSHDGCGDSTDLRSLACASYSLCI